MKKLTITINHPPTTPYDILIGSGLLEKAHILIDYKNYSKAAIITDAVVSKHHLEKLEDSLPIPTSVIIIPPGERGKTITTVNQIWKQLADDKMDRKSVIINLGGGVIGDIGGFAASTYMRGISFINIPTTILAQVDESVGGKTGIDYAGIKNLIGTFKQPAGVIIDVDTLKTLPDRDFISGFAEIIKHGLILDEAYFEKVTSKKPREFTPDELTEIIARSCEIKRDVVENDSTEKGPRKLVNFGHTLGHAIEALSLESDTHLLHGEAVSIGMVAEAKVSQLKNYITEEEVEKIKMSLKHAGLPTTIHGLHAKDILTKITSDKKTISGKVMWTLLKGIGEAVFDEEVDEVLVKEAIDFISE